MREQGKDQRKLAWAFCPACKGALGQLEAKCPHCGYDFPPDPPPPDPDAFTHQFDIRLLFYLMGLMAVVCSICRVLGREAWPLAAPMFVSGILIWRTRKVRYAVLPGLAIGFVVGAVLTLSAEPLVKIGGGIAVATMIACPINAWLMGFTKSGCLAIVIGLPGTILLAWLLAPLLR